MTEIFLLKKLEWEDYSKTKIERKAIIKRGYIN